MKTITNRSSAPRTLARDWDDDTGAYSYFFLNADGLRRVKLVVVKGQTYDASSGYSRDVKAGRTEGCFIFKNVPVGEGWRQDIAAGEAVTVPTSRETFAQSAMRTGEFRSHLQHRATT